MATAETWVTSVAYTSRTATTTVVGAAVIVSGRLAGVLVMAAAGAAAVTRAAVTRAAVTAAPPAYPAVPMAVGVGLTVAAAGITKPAPARAGVPLRLPPLGVSV
jgi:hypothetical protein